MKIVDWFEESEGRTAYTASLGGGLFCDVMHAEDENYAYIMQNADGSEAYDAEGGTHGTVEDGASAIMAALQFAASEKGDKDGQ